ncbi:MAG: hypothetical protein HY744_32275 [Deltaproteobacteria bacterium]|nr:hypothetical protein [Deltaproteobacteria bacterium]
MGCSRLALVLLGALLAPGMPAMEALAGPPPPAQAPRIEVGTELEAVRDVVLRQARLSKGSRVTVRRVVERDGQPVALDLELGDGHVLADVAYRAVAENFRLVRADDRRR